MDKKTRCRRWIGIPSPAMVVACLALAVALSGVGYAAVAVPRNSVGTAQLKRNAVTSLKVKNNALTGADINEAQLGRVPSAARANSANTANSATTANSANTASTASDADRLDSLDSTAFLRTGTVRLALNEAIPGPLPRTTAAFSTESNHLLVSVSASGYRLSVGLGCVDIRVVSTTGHEPSVSVQTCHYFNQTSVHAAFVTRTVYLRLSPGTYWVTLRDQGLVSDSNDHFQVAVLEIP